MKLWQVITEALGSKERSAKVYASTIRRIHRQVYKKELESTNLEFLKAAKALNFVKKIVNLTQKKNAASSIVMGLKAIKAPEKTIAKFRKILMDSDKDYQKFLTSGKRKRPFANAEKTWKQVIDLHKKVGKEIEARNLWSVGGHATGAEYKILMAWIYFKFISTMPVCGYQTRFQSRLRSFGQNWQLRRNGGKAVDLENPQVQNSRSIWTGNFANSGSFESSPEQG